MRSPHYILILMLIVLAICLLPLRVHAKWQTISDDNGMLLERQSHESDVYELRLTTVVDAPMTELIALLQDVRHYPEFLPHFRWVESLSKDQQVSYVYFLLDPPIIRRRDYTLAIVDELTEDGSRFERRFEQANAHGPKPIDSIVRLELIEGYWHLTQLEPNKTHIVHWVKTKPEGVLPDWLTSWGNRRGLIQVVKALTEKAQQQAKN